MSPDDAVRVHLPPVLAPVTGGIRDVTARGGTIGTVLDDVMRQIPALSLHIFDETGGVRRNIICLHQDCVVRAPDMRDHAVAPGDEIVLTNALAGG